jgi:DNA-binding response OmpR family regulator
MPENLLIVEDESIIASSLKMCLEMHDFNVLKIAASGDEALTIIKQNDPDIVLLDVQLRGSLNGFQTAFKIREFSSAPIIYMTGGDWHMINDKARGTDPYDFVVKPYDVDLLVIKIKENLRSAVT